MEPQPEGCGEPERTGAGELGLPAQWSRSLRAAEDYVYPMPQNREQKPQWSRSRKAVERRHIPDP